MRRLAIVVSLVLAVTLVRLLLAASGSGSILPSPTVPPFDASWVRSGSNPIMSPTEAWEDTALSEPMVIYDGSWKMWYRGGWDTQGVGYATSADGVSWTKYVGNPIYGRGGSGMAGNDGAEPWVLKVGSTYWLYATNNDIPRVNVATSADGLAWTTQTSSISLPSGGTLWGNRSVWIEVSTWYMLQEVFNGTIWQIYYYTSSDGLAWSIQNSGNPLTTLQVAAGGMYGGPEVLKFGSTYHCWCHAAPAAGNNPTNIYHATSSDLVTWTQTGAVLTHTGTGEEVDQIADPMVLSAHGTAYLFYDTAINATETGKIMLATAPAGY